MTFWQNGTCSVSSNKENTDITANYDASTSLAEKIKRVSEGSKHNFEGGAKSELDKDTDIDQYKIRKTSTNLIANCTWKPWSTLCK